MANALAASLGWLSRAPGLRILTFHDLGDDAGDLFSIAPAKFAEYLSFLEEEGYVSLRASDLRREWPAILQRERLILLTFDDGYASQRDVGAPLLRRHGFTATFFVISSFLGPTRVHHRFDGKDRTFLGAEDLRQMEREGFEIGAHTHTHPLMGTLPEETVEEEFVLSKRLIEQELGHPLSSFAYPYGRRDAFSQMTRAALQRAGYQTAFTVEGVRVVPGSDLLRLPRINVDRCDTIATLKRKLRGDYELVAKVQRYADER
jgi:peptidoglycan/xylan/chitin deacetylase (PgdA/CDA1 family)